MPRQRLASSAQLHQMAFPPHLSAQLLRGTIGCGGRLRRGCHERWETPGGKHDRSLGVEPLQRGVAG